MRNILFTAQSSIPAMIIRYRTVLITAGIFLVLGIFLGRRSNSVVPLAVEDACAHEHDHDHGHSPDDEGGLAMLETKQCEHAISIVDCADCRYEAGVVKIVPSMAETLIETGLVENVNRTKAVRLTGQIQLDSTRTVEVVSTGAGRVEQVKKFLGDKVEKEDVLAVIHSDDLGQAKAQYLETAAKLELAQATYKREKDLYEQKITSQAEYLDALNELKTMEAAYAAADKKLRLFGLDSRDIARIKDEKENGEFANLILRAGQGGTIIAQNIAVGKMADTTESLYTIADISNLWVWCDVYEKDLAILHEQFAQGRPLEAKIRIKAFEPEVFHGMVDFVGHLMDEHTRTVKMRIQVKNPDNKLRPGMFAEVEAVISLPHPMLAVPRAAVMRDAEKNFVFMRWKDDLWIRRDVSVGGEYGDWVEILGGVPEGASIVTGGAFMLKSDILREKMGAGCAD